MIHTVFPGEEHLLLMMKLIQKKKKNLKPSTLKYFKHLLTTLQYEISM